ncbi:Syntaxin-Binding Protein 5-Like [Manis pentadactyla]|nr:Syntaxin-Binding Protein 5-Like [Manis pentadactyla]
MADTCRWLSGSQGGAAVTFDLVFGLKILHKTKSSGKLEKQASGAAKLKKDERERPDLYWWRRTLSQLKSALKQSRINVIRDVDVAAFIVVFKFTSVNWVTSTDTTLWKTSSSLVRSEQQDRQLVSNTLKHMRKCPVLWFSLLG